MQNEMRTWLRDTMMAGESKQAILQFVGLMANHDGCLLADLSTTIDELAEEIELRTWALATRCQNGPAFRGIRDRIERGEALNDVQVAFLRKSKRFEDRRRQAAAAREAA